MENSDWLDFLYQQYRKYLEELKPLGQHIPSHIQQQQQPQPHTTLLIHRPSDSEAKIGRVRRRTAFTQEQLEELGNEFDTCKYLDTPSCCRLANKLGLPKKTIILYFQNRRAKENRSPLLMESTSSTKDSDAQVETIRRFHRTVFSKRQLVELEEEYNRNIYVARTRCYELAIQFGLPVGTIKRWFKGRRYRQKNKGALKMNTKL